MGWFWQESASASPSSAQSTAQAPAQTTAQAPSRPAQTPKDSKPSSDADPEISRFLEDLMGDVKSTASSENKQPPPPSTSSPADPASGGSSSPPAQAPQSSIAWSSWFSRSSTPTDPFPQSSDTPPSSHQQHTPPPSATETPQAGETAPSSPDETRLSPLAESLLPTTMDCEQAFNQAFYCQSLGGQWNNIYRYGGVKSCSENWDDFWFCMRVKGYGAGKVRDDTIREYYRKKHLAKYGPGKPSSEDVWRERRERLPPGAAFTEPVEAPTVSDAEYQKWEMERAERIRNGGTS